MAGEEEEKKKTVWLIFIGQIFIDYVPHASHYSKH